MSLVQRKTPRRCQEGSATVSLADLSQLLRGVQPDSMKETLIRVRIIVRGRVEQDLVQRLIPGHLSCLDAYNSDIRCEVSLADVPRR